MQFTEQLLTQFPPKTAQEIKHFVEQIEQAPLSDTHWRTIKILYKRIEVQPITEVAIALIHKIDQAPLSASNAITPSTKTIGYMKRRAARFLRQQATDNPSLYIDLCLGLFSKQTKRVNLSQQWVLSNIILGNSKRFEQGRNGRGKILSIDGLANIYRQEEKFPAIWNQHLDKLEAVLFTPHLDPIIYEFASKVLSRNKQLITALPGVQLLSFFKSTSPWLQNIANRQCFDKIEQGAMNDADLLAYAYYYAPADRRTALMSTIEDLSSEKAQAPKSTIQKFIGSIFAKATGASNKQTWLPKFTNILAEIVFKDAAQKRYSRRTNDSSGLISKFKNFLLPDTVKPYASGILQSDFGNLKSLVLSTAKKCKLEDAVEWLKFMDNSPSKDRKELYAVFFDKLQEGGKSKVSNSINEYIYDKNASIADFGWYSLAQRADLRQQVTQNFFNRNYYQGWNAHPFKNFILSDAGNNLMVEYCKNNFSWFGNNQSTFMKMIIHGNQNLKDTALSHLYKVSQHQLMHWLPSIAELKEERDDILAKMLSKILPKNIHQWHLVRFVTHNDEWVRTNTFRIFEKYKGDKATLDFMLTQLVVLGNQAGASSFLEYLLKHERKDFRTLTISFLQEHLQKDPQLINKVIPVFTQLMESLTPEPVIEIIKIVNDQNWQLIEADVQLYVEKNKAAFWTSLLAVIPEQTTDVLVNRTMNNEVIRKTLLEVESISILNCKHPSLEDTLVEWMEHHEKLFVPNSNELYTAAVHQLPKIRTWGLAKIDNATMEMPFGLSLLESAMPPAIEKAKAFFEEKTKDKAHAFEYILALCDSPEEVARTFGIQLMQNRKEQLKTPRALECLSEHSDPTIQAFVAAQLQRTPTNRPFEKTFDKSVLRTKNSSRSAKELIKNRLENNLEIDNQVLLELARGKNKKDAEWAVIQLTKKVLKGEEIPEFVLS